MDAQDLERALSCRGIKLTRRGDDLWVEGPEGELTDEDRRQLRAHKPALLILTWVPVGRLFLDDLSEWPIPWREAWGHLANQFSDVSEVERNDNLQYDAELAAYREIAWRRADGQTPAQALADVRCDLGITDQRDLDPLEVDPALVIGSMSMAGTSYSTLPLLVEKG